VFNATFAGITSSDSLCKSMEHNINIQLKNVSAHHNSPTCATDNPTSRMSFIISIDKQPVEKQFFAFATGVEKAIGGGFKFPFANCPINKSGTLLVDMFTIPLMLNSPLHV